jgi:deferrochelatase/peroxidase EfeB
MIQQLLTIACPLARHKVEQAEALIEALAQAASATPPPASLALLDEPTGEGTHFVSLHAIRSKSSEGAFLLLEVSADGEPKRVLDRVVAGFGQELRTVFTLADNWKDGADLASYLFVNRVKSGAGWLEQPGIGFIGAPGMSVGRIRGEAALAARVADILEESGVADQESALGKLGAVRNRIGTEAPELCLLPADTQPEWKETSLWGLLFKSVGSLLSTYLWPLVPIDGLAIIILAIWASLKFPPPIGALMAKAAIAVLVITLIGVLLAALAAYLGLRAAEKTDFVSERAPNHRLNAEMFERENKCRQNHMISVTIRKPGVIRAFTARLVFWFLSRAIGTISAPGFLGTIGTIHFARWVTVPGTRDLVFLSNYDGSWESYLEDFITRAHEGLTGVWSNTVGFPRTTNLVQGGATDSERFKRFARASMIPTRFWYSAYPALTMAAIRTNREIRRGLSGAMTEDEAAAFLALFGSAARPPAKLVSSGIQSILFGGLGFMKHSRCLVVERLPDDLTAARRWLDKVRPNIAFNDGRRLRRKAVVILGLGPGGLKRLGLPAGSVESFPFAFVEGMAGPGRKQILGDDPAEWQWGAGGADALLMVYGYSDRAVATLSRTLMAVGREAGASAPKSIALETVTDNKSEPFGFVDGISQPVIRGTYKALRNADPIHLVNPGEFILGYPDGRGNMPPGPRLPAIHDPNNLLPLCNPTPGFDRTQVEQDRDIGFNGSFLVVREFAQDVDGFWSYCHREALRLADDPRLPQPYVTSPQFIGAKLLGRWPDGSSLARFPYLPKSDPHQHGSAHATERATTQPEEGHVPVEKPPPPPSDGESENDFLFGAEDPEALRCPFGSHIRRANPRDSLAPGAADEIDIVNRHRIIRVGRPLAKSEPGAPGILFMCLNGDIERQFEFVQQTWLRNPAFHGLTCEKDPVVGDGEEGACAFTIPTREGPVRLSPMDKPFTKVRGGGYFFLPGKRLVNYLAAAS